MDAPFISVGNEVFDQFGHHVISISFAPNNDKARWERKICRLLCMEHGLQNRMAIANVNGINIQGVDRDRIEMEGCRGLVGNIG